MNIRYPVPKNLHQNPAFSQLAVVSGGKTVYIGGQNTVDSEGNIVGKNDIQHQAHQVLENLTTCLTEVNASFENLVKWTVFVLEGQPPQPVFEVFQQVISTRQHPPLITLAYVSALAHPDFLLEIEAIAVVD
ncbi:MAG: RidA family protein [Deinococcota bacterium]